MIRPASTVASKLSPVKAGSVFSTSAELPFLAHEIVAAMASRMTRTPKPRTAQTAAASVQSVAKTFAIFSG